MEMHWAIYWADELRRLADRIERQGKPDLEMDDDAAVAWIEERLTAEPSVRRVIDLYYEYLGTVGIVERVPQGG
jgi:hypothetical protein